MAALSGISAGTTDRDIVHIAFGLDSRYVPHAAAAISSVVAASPTAVLHFIMLHSSIDPDDRRRVAICAPAARFDWLDVSDPRLLSLKTRAHFSAAACYRLALEQLAPPDVKRVLYLDCDVIVLEDITKLWNIDMRGYAAAAVIDPGVDAKDFAARWSIPSEDASYFNSGVMLIDLDVVRARGIFDIARRFLSANDEILSFADQDALNYGFWRQWLKLDPRWNLQRTIAITGTVDGDRLAISRWPSIVHFTTEHKPWLPGSYSPYAWLYWVNLMRTPFRRQVEMTFGIGRLEQLRLLLRYMKFKLSALHAKSKCLQ